MLHDKSDGSKNESRCIKVFKVRMTTNMYTVHEDNFTITVVYRVPTKVLSVLVKL